MNISLICEKKEYNFSLPLEVSLKYIKNLSSKIFKCKAFDIYYKGDKITKEEEEDEEPIFLRDIISCEESNIKLKIVLNSTANNSNNQTPSTTNSPTYSNQTNQTLDVGANDIIQLSKKLYNQKNKLFEAIYSQKVKKLFSSIKEFNKKIIEIDYFLFKKNSKSNNNNLMSFEKNLYEFIDGVRLYFTKLFTILEINNYATYDEMIHNLNNFYKYLNLNDDLEHELNIQNNHEAQTITSTPINKFPINLKKSENTLNLDTYNYFNKSTKKPSNKNSLLLSNKNLDKNKFQIKASLLKDIKNINKNEGVDINNKGNYEFINLYNKNKNYVNKEIKNIIENIDENEKLEKNEDNNNENNIEVNEEKNNIYENIKLDKTGEKKEELDSDSLKKTQTNISEKSINNISSITKKTTKSIESNKNNSSEEDIKEIKNSLTKSENSNNSKEQIVPLNLDLIKKIDSKKENEEIKLQNKIKQPQPSLSQKKSNLKKLNLDSTIQENENENILSSLDNTNNSNKKNNKNNNNKSFSEKKINKKEINKNLNNINKNVAKVVKDSPPKEQKINLVPPPIYHINNSDETEMAKVLSRRLTMKKKKNKTANKYDFII